MFRGALISRDKVFLSMPMELHFGDGLVLGFRREALQLQSFELAQVQDKGTLMGNPNRELQEYSRNIIENKDPGRYIPTIFLGFCVWGSQYSPFTGCTLGGTS